MKNITEDIKAKLEWIKLREDLDVFVQEDSLQKFLRKFNENPLIPIGCMATAGTILIGMTHMYRGNKEKSQMMMRYRVGFQFFTLCAFIGGVAFMSAADDNSIFYRTKPYTDPKSKDT